MQARTIELRGLDKENVLLGRGHLASHTALYIISKTAKSTCVT